MKPEILITGQAYPLAVDSREGILWRVVDVDRPIEETWQDWSGGGFETEHKPGTYLYSDGFDATRQGVLRFSPTIQSLVSSGLSTDFGYFFEVIGATGTLTYDTASSSSVVDQTLAFSHTVAAQSNRLLLIGISTGAGSSLTVTYGGIPCSQAGNKSNGLMDCWLFYLLSPPTGANTVSITVDISSSIAAGAVSFYNVNQTTPLGTWNSTTGSSTSPSVTIASATGEIVTAVLVTNVNRTVTPGTSETERWEQTVTTVLTGWGGTEAGAASVVINRSE